MAELRPKRKGPNRFGILQGYPDEPGLRGVPPPLSLDLGAPRKKRMVRGSGPGRSPRQEEPGSTTRVNGALAYRQSREEAMSSIVRRTPQKTHGMIRGHELIRHSWAKAQAEAHCTKPN
jgi:hypothetical protein